MLPCGTDVRLLKLSKAPGRAGPEAKAVFLGHA